MGRVCSALPGSTVGGMAAPHARPYEPAVGDGVPSIPVPADPPPEASSLTVERYAGSTVGPLLIKRNCLALLMEPTRTSLLCAL